MELIPNNNKTKTLKILIFHILFLHNCFFEINLNETLVLFNYVDTSYSQEHCQHCEPSGLIICSKLDMFKCVITGYLNNAKFLLILYHSDFQN